MADATYQSFDHSEQNQTKVSTGKQFVNFIKSIQSYRAKSRAVIELQSMDNRMLKDIGITRGEISHRVWNEA